MDIYLGNKKIRERSELFRLYIALQLPKNDLIRFEHSLMQQRSKEDSKEVVTGEPLFL